MLKYIKRTNLKRSGVYDREEIFINIDKVVKKYSRDFRSDNFQKISI